MVALLSLFACGREPAERDAPRDQTAGELAACEGATCVLEFTHLYRLGSFDGDDAFEGMPRSVAGLESGEVVIGVPSTTPYRFSGAGDYLGRVGRRGEGPGEFMSVSVVASGPADSLTVIDARLKRLTVVGPGPAFVVGRTDRIPLLDIGLDAVVLVDGRLAVNGQTGGTRGGFSVVLMGGVDPLELDPYPAWSGEGEPFDFGRLLAASGGGGLWSADHLEYVIRRWSPNGVLVDSIRRAPNWFEGRSEYAWGFRNPGSRIQALWEDDQGRLWVIVWRARDTWEEAWRALPEERIILGEVQARDRPRAIELFSTVVEILDAETGELLHSQPWPGLVLAGLPENRVAVLTEDLLGVPYVDIWDYKWMSPAN